MLAHLQPVRKNNKQQQQQQQQQQQKQETDKKQTKGITMAKNKIFLSQIGCLEATIFKTH